MPLNMTKAMADCLRQAATWLREEARLHDTGEVVRVRDGRDESKEYAKDLIHRWKLRPKRLAGLWTNQRAYRNLTYEMLCDLA